MDFRRVFTQALVSPKPFISSILCLHATMNSKNTIIGLDYGSRYIGVSISDAVGVGIAKPLRVFDQKDKTTESIYSVGNGLEKLLMQYRVAAIVVGMPYLAGAVEDEQCERIRGFVKSLHENVTKLPVFLWDEKETSKQVKDMLRMQGMRVSNHKSLGSDKLTACLILQRFLEYSKAVTTKYGTKTKIKNWNEINDPCVIQWSKPRR